MSKKRKLYSPQFKAKIAIEAIQGQKTTPELASQYDVHPTMINTWKRQLIDQASELFAKGKAASQAQSDNEAQINELYRQIGQLKVERDFLAKRSAQLGLVCEKPW
jgi:transposase-like protein